MATGSLAPAFWWTALTDAGVPIDGAKLYFYLSGTTTPAPVYHDANLNTAWAFPAVTDSAGRIVVYLDPSVGNLKMIQTDENDVPVGLTVDPITPTNSGAAGLGEVFVFGSNSSASVTVTSYPSGAGYDKLHPGTSVWIVDPATLSGTYVLEDVAVQTTSGTFTAALVNLDSGAPDTPLVTCATTSLTGETVQSSAITFPPGGSEISFGIKTKVSANDGYLIGARIVRTA